MIEEEEEPERRSKRKSGKMLKKGRDAQYMCYFSSIFSCLQFLPSIWTDEWSMCNIWELETIFCWEICWVEIRMKLLDNQSINQSISRDIYNGKILVNLSNPLDFRHLLILTKPTQTLLLLSVQWLLTVDFTCCLPLALVPSTSLPNTNSTTIPSIPFLWPNRHKTFCFTFRSRGTSIPYCPYTSVLNLALTPHAPLKHITATAFNCEFCSLTVQVVVHSTFHYHTSLLATQISPVILFYHIKRWNMNPLWSRSHYILSSLCHSAIFLDIPRPFLSYNIS